jgi:hypothetical protein
MFEKSNRVSLALPLPLELGGKAQYVLGNGAEANESLSADWAAV